MSLRVDFYDIAKWRKKILVVFWRISGILRSNYFKICFYLSHDFWQKSAEPSLARKHKSVMLEATMQQANDKRSIVRRCGCKVQFVPPNIHRWCLWLHSESRTSRKCAHISEHVCLMQAILSTYANKLIPDHIIARNSTNAFPLNNSRTIKKGN